MEVETEELNEGQIVIDGETEVDDLLLASKFAELEHFKSQSILTDIESSRGRKAVAGKSSEDIDIVLTDQEESDSERDGYESSENEDAEVQELVKKEMAYRNRAAEKQRSNREGLGEKLSDAYLSQFGISMEKSRGSKSVLSDISECEDETAESGDDAIKKAKAGGGVRRGVNLEGIEEKLSWLPNIEILDMPEKVDTSLPCEFVGEIYSVISDGAIFGMEGIFIVKSDPSSIILDLGSVLCLEDKTIVGAIIDTFGPIASPFYVLSKQNNVDGQLLKIGTRIYCDRRHSTILGKAGKVKCSYFSKNASSKVFASKSPFSNKEFKKDPKSRTPENAPLSGQCSFPEGPEFDDGQVIPGDYDEDDEDEQEESGDDIGVGLKEASVKKFVERYDNLGSIQDSAMEDSAAAYSELSKRQKKPSNQGQSQNNNSRTRSKVNRWRHPGRHSSNSAGRPPQWSCGNFPQQGFGQFGYGQNFHLPNPNQQRQTPEAEFGFSQGHVFPQSRPSNFARFSNSKTFTTPKSQQGAISPPFYYPGPGFPAPSAPQHNTQYAHQGPHHHSRMYPQANGSVPQYAQSPYQSLNPPHQMPVQTPFENSHYLTDMQFNAGSPLPGNPYIYAGNNNGVGANSNFAHGGNSGKSVGGGSGGELPGFGSRRG